MSFASLCVAPKRRFVISSGCTSAGRRSLAVTAAASKSGHLCLSSPPLATTGYYYHAAVHVPTCRSIRQMQRRPLTIIFFPGITIGNSTSSRLMTSSSGAPQYFEGPWYEKYLLLEQYKKEHGHCLVRKSFVLGDVKLGAWVHKQRRLYNEETLSTNRREMLDALGFSWNPRADQWERNFALLKQFEEREGHCDVPFSHKEDGIKLGIWLSNQRKGRGKMEESLQRRLEQLGVSWDPYADRWERNFALLEQFKEREGHCIVMCRHVEDGIKLGAWLDTQRTKMKRGKLDGSYKCRLEELGVSWNPLSDEWEQNFALLEQFKEREGHCNVPQAYEENGVNLGRWLHRQRQAKKGNEGTLDDDQRRRLEGLGVIWEPRCRMGAKVRSS